VKGIAPRDAKLTPNPVKNPELPEWSSYDFIVNGTYCDTETIRSELGRLRETHLAEAAVLLFRQHETIFPELMILSHEGPKRQNELQKILHKPLRVTLNEERVEPQQLWDAARKAEPLKTFFAEFPPDVDCPIIPRVFRLPRLSGFGRTDDARIETALVVAFINPRIPARDIPLSRLFQAQEHAATCLLLALRLFCIHAIGREARLRMLVWMSSLTIFLKNSRASLRESDLSS
jgi:hypothetical protein